MTGWLPPCTLPLIARPREAVFALFEKEVEQPLNRKAAPDTHIVRHITKTAESVVRAGSVRMSVHPNETICVEFAAVVLTGDSSRVNIFS
jgi:hypothetical protein